MEDGRKDGRQRRRVLTLGGLLLLLGLAYLGSVAFRSWHLYDKIRDDRYGVTGVLHRADHRLGFVPIPGAEGAHVLPVGPPVPTRYDEHGWRVPIGEREERQRPYFLALGCSFTYGEACAAEEAYPFQLAQQLGGSELNGGVCAWGLAQMYVRGRALIPEWKPEYVIVQYSPWLTHRATNCFAPTHCGRLPVPYFVDAGEAAVELYPPAFPYRDGLDFAPYRPSGEGRGFVRFLLEIGAPLSFYDDSRYLVFRHLCAIGEIPEPTRRDGAVVGHVYGVLRDVCRQQGAQMIVVVIGRGWWPVPVPPELAALGVPIVDAQAELLARLPVQDEESWKRTYTHVRGDPPVFVDWHPNPRAHALIAELIAEEIGQLPLAARNR